MRSTRHGDDSGSSGDFRVQDRGRSFEASWADLLSRIRLRPIPGTATERDLIRVVDGEGVPCELIDGVLVEKVLDYRKGVLVGDDLRGQFLRA